MTIPELAEWCEKHALLDIDCAKYHSNPNSIKNCHADAARHRAMAAALRLTHHRQSVGSFATCEQWVEEDLRLQDAMNRLLQEIK